MATPITDLGYVTRDAEVATMARRESNAAVSGVSSGVVVAGAAMCLRSGRYGTIRCFLTNGGASLTNLRLGVWTPDGANLLASTADIKASAGTNVWLSGSLDAAVALAAGDVVVLGIGCAHGGTSVGVRGAGIQSASILFSGNTDATVFAYRGANAGTFTTGALPGTLATNAGPGILPLMELAA